MFQLGTIDVDQLKAYHMDLGYKESDADNFVKVDRVDRIRHLATSGHAWTPQAIASAFAIGQMSAAAVRERMTGMFYPEGVATELMARSKTEFDRTVLV